MGSNAVDENTKVNHVLPGERGGDSSWFHRLNDFQQAETLRQIEFKRKRWPELPNGLWTKRKNYYYPHILPADSAPEMALSENLAEEAVEYYRKNDIEIHTEFLNLKSSQACCTNFLFPLLADTGLALRVLSYFLPECDKVTRIEFEYCGADMEGLREWLGEPKGGKRGQNRTSIDAAVFWETRGRTRATLIEWKYTEANYGECSKYKGAKKANARESSNCEGLPFASDPDSPKSCMLTFGGNSASRKYWERLDTSGINLSEFTGVVGCPFRGPFYQVMRQYLVAAYMMHVGKEAESVDVMSIGFKCNRFLHHTPKTLQAILPAGKVDILSAWNGVLKGVSVMRHSTVEELMQRYDSTNGVEPRWREYVCERYGL